MAKVVQFILLPIILATVSNGEDRYAGCLMNYSVLEQAVIEDDRYEIIKAFYPPEISLPSVFVKIMYAELRIIFTTKYSSSIQIKYITFSPDQS